MKYGKSKDPKKSMNRMKERMNQKSKDMSTMSLKGFNRKYNDIRNILLS